MLLLGQIYRAEGDHDAAEYEISAALSTFERIGAVPAAEQARELLAALTQPAGAHGRRVAKTFLFSDVVKSTNLLEAIGDDAWTHLLECGTTTRCGSYSPSTRAKRSSTWGMGSFVAFDDAAKAVACAIAIQRSLADHRRAHGFAPQVRIGLHATEAAEVQGNYPRFGRSRGRSDRRAGRGW